MPRTSRQHHHVYNSCCYRPRVKTSRSRKEITLADGLLRLPNKDKNKQIKLDVKINLVQFIHDKKQQLKEESRRDPLTNALRTIIIEGWPVSQDELSVEDAIFVKGIRIFFLEAMRKDIIDRIHAAHQGVEKCVIRARTCIYFPRMKQDIEEEVQVYNTCRVYSRSQSKETTMPHEVPTRS